jgi:hypothetical protein
MRKIFVLITVFLFSVTAIAFAGGGPQAMSSKSSTGSTQDEPTDIFQTIYDSVDSEIRPGQKADQSLFQTAYDSLEKGFAVSETAGDKNVWQSAYDDVPSWDDTASQAKQMSLRNNKAELLRRRNAYQRF